MDLFQQEEVLAGKIMVLKWRPKIPMTAVAGFGIQLICKEEKAYLHPLRRTSSQWFRQKNLQCWTNLHI